MVEASVMGVLEGRMCEITCLSLIVSIHGRLTH